MYAQARPCDRKMPTGSSREFHIGNLAGHDDTALLKYCTQGTATSTEAFTVASHIPIEYAAHSVHTDTAISAHFSLYACAPSGAVNRIRVAYKTGSTAVACCYRSVKHLGFSFLGNCSASSNNDS